MRLPNQVLIHSENMHFISNFVSGDGASGCGCFMKEDYFSRKKYLLLVFIPFGKKNVADGIHPSVCLTSHRLVGVFPILKRVSYSQDC